MSNYDYSEPAVLRGIWTAAVTLLGSLGVVVSADLNGVAEAVIVVLATVIPLVQGWWTRRNVVSPQTHARALGQAASGLGNGPQV